MNEKQQRILVIILFVAAAVLFAFFLYWFFWRPILSPFIESQKPVTSTTVGGLTGSGIAGQRFFTSTTQGGLAGGQTTGGAAVTSSATATGGLTKTTALVKDPTAFVQMNSNGQINYFNQKDGKFYTVDASGNIVTLSDKTFFGTQSAVWNSSGGKAVIKFLDNATIVYDFTTQKQTTLPSHWEDFDFAPAGDTFAFKNIGLDVENRYLVTSNPDGSGAKIIDDIGKNANKVQVNWSPNNQVVANYIEGKDATRSEVYFLGQNKENFKSMIVEGRDFQSEWSPSGHRLLYSVYDVNNDYKPQLWISDATGDNIGANRQKIDLQTWVDKCSFASEQYVFCSAPEQMPYGAGLDRRTTAGIADDIWIIDLATGATKMIAKPEGVNSISQIMYSQNSADKLFFSDASSGQIHQINLK